MLEKRIVIEAGEEVARIVLSSVGMLMWWGVGVFKLLANSQRDRRG